MVAHAAWADDLSTGAGPLSEIVVTATRQEEPLSRVPVSVTAFSQQTLDDASIRNIDDLGRITPGLSVISGNGGAGNQQNISIRGISSTVGAATTGIYVDDTPIQVRALSNATTDIFPQIFDLDRVEVLRGPQGTLFGAGAEGGVVRFITRQASLTDYSGIARSELSFTEDGGPSYEFGGALGGPIVQDTLGFRLSGVFRQEGGYIDRVDGFTGQLQDANANRAERYSLHGALKWAPLENLSVSLTVMTQVNDVDDTSLMFQDLSNPRQGLFRQSRVLPSPARDSMTLPTLDVRYDFGSFQLISTTSTLNRSARVRPDTTNFIQSQLFGAPGLYPPGQFDYAEIDDWQNEFNQEVRLQSKGDSRLSWTVGAFYSRSAQHGSQVNVDPYIDSLFQSLTGVTLAEAGLPLLNGDELFQTSIHSTDKQTAGFGQIDYELLSGFKATAGVRVARSGVTLSRESAGPVAGGGGTFSGVTQSETPVTPKFGLSYQMNPNNLFYASASKGYRVGGVNGPQISLCDATLASLGLTASSGTYKSDSVWSYEVGSKNKWLEGRLQIDASAFTINWNNIQQEINLASCGSGFVTNLGKAKSSGFDLAVNVMPVDHLTLGFTAEYADARLTQTVNGPGGAIFGIGGDKIGGAPWQAGTTARYEFAVQSARPYLQLDYQYTSKGPTPDVRVFGNDPEIGAFDSFSALALRAGTYIHDWNISVFVNNALDRHPILNRNRDIVTSPVFYEYTVPPRTLGVTAEYRF